MPVPQIFDRRLVRLHRDRAAPRVSTITDVLAGIAETLLERLEDTRLTPKHALDLGGRGAVAPLLHTRGIEVVTTDLSLRMAALHAQAVCADEEFLPFAPESFDLAVANLSLHTVNDLPGALAQIRQTLRPHGLFLASIPLLGTLAELRAAFAETESRLRGGLAPRVSPFPELRDCAALLQRAGFALPVADLTELKLLYANPMRLIEDLRCLGETNALTSRERTIPPRELFAQTLASLKKGEHIEVTLKIGILTGWK